MNGLSDGFYWQFSKQTVWLLSYFLVGLECSAPVANAILVNLMIHCTKNDSIFSVLFERIKKDIDHCLTVVNIYTTSGFRCWSLPNRNIQLSTEVDQHNAPFLVVLSGFHQNGILRSEVFFKVSRLGDKLGYAIGRDVPCMIIWPDILDVVDENVEKCIDLFLTPPPPMEN